MNLCWLRVATIGFVGVVILGRPAADAFGQDERDWIWPSRTWPAASPSEAGMDESLLKQARDYALAGQGSGFITRRGRLVLSWGDPKQRYDLKSTSKSIGVTALGLAIGDGKIRLSDLACQHHPRLGVPPAANERTGWIDRITIQHLATQTAGFEKLGGYEKLVFPPGAKWHYSDGGPNWLAECVTLAYGRDLQELMFERVFSPLGITRDDLVWRKNAYRPPEINGIARREFGSGVSANVDAMARIGYLYLRKGRWKDQQIIPASFVESAAKTIPEVAGLPEHSPLHGDASDHYGLLWWNNADGALAGVPRNAYWSWGLYDSLIAVFPNLDIVAARAGQSWRRQEGAGHYDVLGPFFQPLVASVRGESG
jgi:CubicO group peptidase (beta-lactamase class C family)